MQKKLPFFYLNITWESLVFLTVVGLSSYFLIIESQKLLQNLGPVSFSLLIVMLVIAILIYAVIILSGMKNFDQKDLAVKEGLLYATFSLNLPWIWILVSQEIKKPPKKFFWKKMDMFDLTLISMSVACFIVLALIDNFLIPSIPPLFISLPLHYLPLFFLAYVTGSFSKTLIAGLIAGLMLIVLPGTYFINFGQFTFDYLLPSMAIAFASLINFDHHQVTQKNLLKWILFIALPMLLVFGSQVIAGIIFYQANAWQGISPWLFSIVVNGINVGLEFIFLVFFVPINLNRLWPLRNKYLVKNNS